jgi:fucose permease
MERLGMTLNEAAFATSLYFIFRTIGCFTGTFFLRVMSNRLFFVVSVLMMALSMAGLAVGETKPVLYVAIALVGYGNSNIFSLVFSQAILSDRKRQNEISGLMIMGLFGGTIFPLLMGVASDAIGQVGAVAVMACGVVYLAFYSLTPMSVTLEDGAPSARKRKQSMIHRKNNDKI